MESQRLEQTPRPPVQEPSRVGRPVPPVGLESLSGGVVRAKYDPVPEPPLDEDPSTASSTLLGAGRPVAPLDPSQPDMSVRLSVRQTSPARHAAKWLLAMLGVFALYLVLQITVSLVSSVFIMAADYAASAAGGAAGSQSEAIYDNGFNLALVASQLLAVAVFLPWWRHIRPGSFAERRTAIAPQKASLAKTIVALALIGVGAQFFVSAILGLVEMLAPEMIAEYAELMEDASTGVFVLISAIATTILAPLNEELVCRGVMLEYAMRAVSPWWDERDRSRRHAVSARAFWAANVLQALAFGVLHMNLIQGSYAFALGVAQGWVFWRTGKLRYAILLHFALNASSYLVEPLAPFVNMLPVIAIFALFGAMLAAGIWLFNNMWNVSDELPELPCESSTDPCDQSEPLIASSEPSFVSSCS